MCFFYLILLMLFGSCSQICFANIVVELPDFATYNLRKNDTTITQGKLIEVQAPVFYINTTSSQATSSLQKEQLQQLLQPQISEVLATIPGVFILNYYGVGGLKTVSLRGATSSQTLVTLDGVRLNTTTSGGVDVAQIPTTVVDNITVTRGGNSALHGSHALGGIIEIETNQPQKNQAPVNSLLCYGGSFSEIGANATTELPLLDSILGMRLLASTTFQQTQGNYSFEFNQFGRDTTLQRTNGFAQYLSSMVVLSPLEKTSPIVPSIRLILRSSERGAPGAVLQGNIENQSARLYEDDALCIVRWKQNSEHSNAILSAHDIRLFTRYNQQRYFDSLSTLRGVGGIRDLFISRDIGVLTKSILQHGFDNSTIITLSTETIFNTLHGTLYSANSGNSVKRLSIGAMCSIMNSQQISDWLLLTTGAFRLDYISDIYTVLSPTCQFMLTNPTYPFTFRTSISYNFRPPAFNELYYQNFGNTALQPERNLSIDAGVTYSFKPNIVIELSGFYSNTLNQIMAVPRNPVTWTAMNIGKVSTLGIDAAMQCMYFGNALQLRTGFTLQSVTNNVSESIHFGKRVIYTPSVISMITTSLSLQGLLRGYTLSSDGNLGFTTLINGSRYVQPDNSFRSLLPSFITSNIWYAQTLQLFGLNNMTMRVDVQNVFNEQYSVLPNFPMPGRSFRLSFQAEI